MVPTDADSSTLSVFYDLVFLEHDPPVGAFNQPPDDRLAVAEPHPDLLLVSAGQDPSRIDPDGRNLVTTEGFYDLGRRARGLAARTDAGLALVQEGGYQITALAYDTLGALCGALDLDTDADDGPDLDDPFDHLNEYRPPATAWIDDAVDAHAEYWPLDG